jgi:Fic family protein
VLSFLSVMKELPTTREGLYVERSVNEDTVRCFVPAPLPPAPPLNLSGEHVDWLERANRALGRLDGISTLLPDTSLFVYNYVRKEAVLSSQIEGTQSSLSDLLLFENHEMPGVPLDDVREVSNYVRALEHGLGRVRKENFPISSRLLRELHDILLEGDRGASKAPGEFRRSQVWLGSARPKNASFVPPPFDYVEDLMANLENFIHDTPTRTPTLIKAALAHVQFETIHPFLDGNGRLGRLLITLLLCAEGVVTEPTLYLSLYFKTHREEYYEALQRVRTHGEWEGWLEFFLRGVEDTAQQAFKLAQALVALFERDRERVQTLGRGAGSALQVLQFIQRKVFFSVAETETPLKLSAPTIRKSVEGLEGLGILEEITGKGRNRLWVYRDYLTTLASGTEPEGEKQ